MSFKISSIEDIKVNRQKEPRIAIERVNSIIEKIYIISSTEIWQTYEASESILVILIYLYSYYFVVNISYPTCFEICLGFFHEAMQFNTPVHFDKKRSMTYLKLIAVLLENLK